MLYFYIFVLIFVLLLLAIALYFYFSVLISLIRSKWVPYVPSFDSEIELMKKLDIKPWKIMLDLWCWDWKVLRFFSNHFYMWKCYWYDISWFAVNYWRIINYFKNINNVELIKKDFSHAKFDWVDYIFVYLMPNMLERIEDWLFDSIGNNTVIISNTFKFKKHLPFETIFNSRWYAKIYLYRK